MACTGPKTTCRSPGVGPHCDPTKITIRADTTGLLPDQITSVNIKDDPQSKLGAKRKKKCIEDEQMRIDKMMHSCMCDCIDRMLHTTSQVTAQQAGNKNGVPLYCFGKCYEDNSQNMDFTSCYCMETVCGSAAENNTKDTTNPSDPAKGNDGGSTTPADNAVKTRYEYAKLGPQINAVRSSSSYDVHIPKIYNRGPVGGNVIWIGNPRQIVRHVSETTQDSAGNLTVTDTEVTQSFCDFILALCEGPIEGVARLWLNDVLVYNNVMPTDQYGIVQDTDGAMILARDNFGFFSKIDNKDKYLNTVAKITVFNGSEEQTSSVPGEPAYRGLAYVLVENFDLSFTSGAIPNMRADVVERAATVEPRQSTADGLVDGPLMFADEANRRLVVGSKVLDYDTLATLSTLKAVPASAVAGNPLGDFAFRAGGELSYVNLSTGVTGDTLSGLAPYGAGAFVTPREVNTSLPQYYVGAERTSLRFFRVDNYGAAWADRGTIPNITSDKISYVYSFDATETTASNESINNYYAVAISAPETALSHIRVQHVLLYDTKYTHYFRTDIPIISHDAQISNLAWGRDTTAKLVSVIRDARDDGLVFFVGGVNGAYAFKWDYLSNSVLWSRNIPAVPTGNLSTTANSSIDDVYFIGRDAKLYSLTLRTGSVVHVASAAIDIAPNSAQYYDTGASALTYVTSAGAVARKFIGRLTSGDISVADILSDLMLASGLPDDGINVAPISSIPAHGYVITNQTTARAAIQQLLFYFGLTARESNGKLTYHELSLATNTNITYDHFSEKSAQYERKILDASVRSVDVGYLAIDNAMAETHQVVKLAGQDGLDDVAFSFPMVLTTTEAGRVAERLAATLSSDGMLANVHVGPEFLHLEPGDYVTLYDNDDKSTQFRIDSATIGANMSSELALIKDSLVFYTESSGLTPVVVSTGGSVDMSQYLPTATMRPLIALTNSITNAHIPNPVTGKYASGFYMGVDYRGALPMPKTAVYVENGGVMRVSGEVTEPMYWGSVVSVSPENDSSYFTEDTDESVVIRFVRNDFASHLKQGATTLDLDDTSVNMLLVNDELIQFKNYSIDPDGHTVTFTNLLRGRRGTEWAITQQTNAGLAFLYTPNGCADVVQYADYTPQVVTVGVKTGEAKFNKANLVNHHAMLKPYAPSNLSIHKLLTGDLSLQFQRRTRYAEPDNTKVGSVIYDHPDGSVSLDFDDVRSYDIYFFKRELSASYMRDIAAYLDIPGVTGHPEVYRWIKAYNIAPWRQVDGVFVNTPFTVLYSKPQQVVDGFDSATDTLYIAIHQRGGEFLTRGHPLYATLEPV